MPNINITYRCNLHCPYCFANEFVNKSHTDITYENFLKAVEFITRHESSSIGLIGGEPLLHPLFGEFISELNNNDRVNRINIYSNGLLVNNWLDELAEEKVEILVNCNSPAQIGEKAFNLLKQNLLKLSDIKKDKFLLGINIFNSDINYNYILDLLEIINQKTLRISLSVPDFSANKYNGPIYFFERKRLLFDVLSMFNENGITPFYDCNIVPTCVWAEDDIKTFSPWIQHKNIIYTNVGNEISVCEPVIDILPNLQATRCFGMSDVTKVNIENFNTLNDLIDYYKEIDRNLISMMPTPENCKSCSWDKKCYKGCLGFYKHLINEESETHERE